MPLRCDGKGTQRPPSPDTMFYRAFGTELVSSLETDNMIIFFMLSDGRWRRGEDGREGVTPLTKRGDGEKIVCQVPENRKTAFSPAQCAWKAIREVDGFYGQWGGWNVRRPTEAGILALWRDCSSHDAFMSDVHDSIFHGTKQEQPMNAFPSPCWRASRPFPWKEAPSAGHCPADGSAQAMINFILNGSTPSSGNKVWSERRLRLSWAGR